MRVDAPLRHAVEDALGMVHHDFEPVRIEDVQLRVSDKAADLKDVVGLRIEASHLGFN